MAEQGCLVISDITGYTAYLNEAELDHARDTLASLVQLLVDHTRSPLVIIELEGDAIFSYAPAGSFLESQTLLEIVENTYAAFRKALELMILNTTCTCNACRLLPTLDLKFFIHQGTFVIQKVAGHTKLVGRDVNLLHRLLKNTIAPTLGLKAYAAFTEPVVEALDLGELVAGMPEHTERYDDIGEVRLYVQDMAGVWEKKRESIQLEVRPDETIGILEFDFPLPAHLLWEYITKPEYRTLLLHSDSQRLTRGQDGRTGPGSTYYCAHGSMITAHTILEWRPFESYTAREAYPFPNTAAHTTYRLEPIEGGTRLVILAGKAFGPPVLRTLGDAIGRFMGIPYFKQGAAALRKQVEADLDAGKVALSPEVGVAEELVLQAANQSLRR